MILIYDLLLFKTGKEEIIGLMHHPAWDMLAIWKSDGTTNVLKP